MRYVLSLLIAALLWAQPLTAQELPTPLTSYVSDYIGLLSAAENAALTEDLKDLRSEHGVEMAVVLMPSRSTYGSSETLEAFATRLFDTWGIGNKSRNDGILFLVLKDDRLTRIELGKAYGQGWNGTAARVLDRHVLPHFKNDEYARGVSGGTAEIIATIALPHQAGDPPRSSDWIGWLTTAILVAVGAFVFIPLLFGRFLRDRYTRMSRCPNCGQRTLGVSRRTKVRARKQYPGQKERRVRCGNCDYDDTQVWRYSAATSSGSSGGSFGGGRSGGGGASGSW